MARPQLNGETLMAYVDGALDVETARAVEDAAAHDEAIAAQLAMLKRTREEARVALAPLLGEPVPDALEARIRAFAARHPAEAPAEPPAEPAQSEEGNVVAFRPRAKRPVWSNSSFGMGIAASVALVVGLGAGFFAGGGVDPFTDGIETARFDQPGLLEAMQTVPSGADQQLPDGTTFRAIATFAVDGGALCREFEMEGAERDAVVAVACHNEGVWETRFTVATQAQGDGFAPAASLDVLQTYLSAVGAQVPLDEDAEAAALNALR